MIVCHVRVIVIGDDGHAGKWTVQQAAELSVAAPTIEAALDGRFLSGLKDERKQAANFYQSKHGLKEPAPLKVCSCNCKWNLMSKRLPKNLPKPWLPMDGPVQETLMAWP